jgi:hypothetical protein
VPASRENRLDLSIDLRCVRIRKPPGERLAFSRVVFRCKRIDAVFYDVSRVFNPPDRCGESVTDLQAAAKCTSHLVAFRVKPPWSSSSCTPVVYVICVIILRMLLRIHVLVLSVGV